MVELASAPVLALLAKCGLLRGVHEHALHAVRPHLVHSAGRGFAQGAAARAAFAGGDGASVPRAGGDQR